MLPPRGTCQANTSPGWKIIQGRLLFRPSFLLTKNATLFTMRVQAVSRSCCAVIKTGANPSLQTCRSAGAACHAAWHVDNAPCAASCAVEKAFHAARHASLMARNAFPGAGHTSHAAFHACNVTCHAFREAKQTCGAACHACRAFRNAFNVTFQVFREPEQA